MLTRRGFLAAGGAMALLRPETAWADTGFSLRGTAWERTALLARLDPYLLYAVSYVESRLDRKGSTGPWPFAVRTAAESYYPADFTAAMTLIHGLPPDQVADADLGWMQVNVRWHGRRVPDISHLLHPEINMRVGAGILREALDSMPGDLELAIGRYHVWMDEPRARDYGRRVLALRQRMLAS